MVVEMAVLDVQRGQESQFESAMASARPLIAETAGFLGLQLRRCLESPNRYLLLVHWHTVEDHTVGFRQSECYQQWRALLHHFYDPFPTVQHYGDTLALE